MAWYYHLNGENKGPVELSELQQLHGSSVITSETPVWTEGMADWATYGASTAVLAAAPVVSATKTTLVPVVGATQICAECHKPFPESEMLKYENSWVCPSCKPFFFQRIKEGVVPVGTLKYASVGKRFLAILIDGIILQLAITAPIALIFGIQGINHVGMPATINVLVYLVQYLGPALYEILLISKYGATFGKMAMKIKVVTPDGGPISMGRSTGRYFAKMLSGLILCIGYLMAFWDPEKRALHDRICDTRVIDTAP